MNTTISSNGPSSQLPPAKHEQGIGPGQEPSTAAPASQSRPAADDSVRLTDSARALQQAAATDQAGHADPAKIERLRQSLADGDYRIDAGAIADRLSSLESQLFGP